MTSWWFVLYLIVGYFGNIEKKLQAQDLRRTGHSYPQIQKLIDVPKSTLSGWCRDVALTEKQALRLFNNKLRGAAKGRIIGAKRQQARRLAEIKEQKLLGEKEIGKISQRDRFLTGIALYSAEGTKADKSCSFANSDPKLIKFMTAWFREFCEVPESRLRGAIWIHDNLDTQNAMEYWSNVTGIPRPQFYKTYIAKNRADSVKIRKNIHKYGVFSVRFSDAKIHRRIMGWISGLLDSELI